MGDLTASVPNVLHLQTQREKQAPSAQREWTNCDPQYCAAGRTISTHHAPFSVYIVAGAKFATAEIFRA